MLHIVLKVLIGGADGLRCWPLTFLSCPQPCHAFSAWRVWSSLSSGNSLKGFASLFFPEFHCFSSQGCQGEQWIAYSTVTCSSILCWRPPECCMWFAALHVTNMFSSPAASVFSGGFISLLLRKICLATPQSSSDGKTSILLFIHGLKLP